MKYIFLAVKILIVLAVAGWVCLEVYRSWDKIHLLQWKPDYFYLCLSGVLYAAAFIPSVVFWRYAMQQFGLSPRWYDTFRAYYIGHLGKYVPGKALTAVIRAGLLSYKDDRQQPALTPRILAAAAVFLETMTMMAAGASLAVLMLCIGHRDIIKTYPVILLLFPASLFPILPPVFRFITKKILPKEQSEAMRLTFKTLLIGWMLMILLWIVLGLSTWAVVRGIGVDMGTMLPVLPRFVLAATLSIVLGFITMVPGGFVVREFVLAQVLTAFFATLPEVTNPSLTAIAVAGVQRLVSITAEIAVSVILAVPPKP